jgi:RNA polymerase sigma-70 factor (ECF subfamily)
MYSTYSDDYLLTLLRQSDDISIAEELAQDIFLDIWKMRIELDVKGELQAYLAVAMKYRVINQQGNKNGRKSLGKVH